MGDLLILHGLRERTRDSQPYNVAQLVRRVAAHLLPDLPSPPRPTFLVRRHFRLHALRPRGFRSSRSVVARGAHGSARGSHVSRG